MCVVRRVKTCVYRSAFSKLIWRKLSTFSCSIVHVYEQILRKCRLKDISSVVNRRFLITIFSSSTTMLFDQLVRDRASFCLFSHDIWPSLYCRSHECAFFTTVSDTIIACLTQVTMNFDGCHSAQVEIMDNNTLSFKRERPHLQYLKCNRCEKATRGLSRTVLPSSSPKLKE